MVTVKRELDPLLKDLSEKKHNFQQNVMSLVAELKEVHSRLASQDQYFAKELIRQEAETKAKMMEEDISRLQKNLEDKDVQLQASASAADTYVKELDDLRLQLTAAQSTANASVLSAQSAQLQCATLANLSFAREFSRMQLKDEVSRIELEIMEALAKAGSNQDCELRRTLEEVTPRNFDKINKLLRVKDEEIAKLRDEIRTVSAHWKLKIKELESQLEKNQRADAELKKRVSKLKFRVQEARTQKHKLQRMGEQKHKALKEFRDQLAAKRLGVPQSTEEQNFWGFKIVVSMSMLVMVMFSKR